MSHYSVILLQVCLVSCGGGNNVSSVCSLGGRGVRPFRRVPGRRRCVSTWSGQWAPRVSGPDFGSLERLRSAEEGSGCTGGGGNRRMS